MAIITWSPAALDDVDAIAEFISRDSRDRAALFIDRLIASVDRLERYPYTGRVIPEIGSNESREIIYGAYRIMYRVKNDEVWINGVIHGARDWKP